MSSSRTKPSFEVHASLYLSALQTESMMINGVRSLYVSMVYWSLCVAIRRAHTHTHTRSYTHIHISRHTQAHQTSKNITRDLQIHNFYTYAFYKYTLYTYAFNEYTLLHISILVSHWQNYTVHKVFYVHVHIGHGWCPQARVHVRKKHATLQAACAKKPPAAARRSDLRVFDASSGIQICVVHVHCWSHRQLLNGATCEFLMPPQVFRSA
jgi:hypothetical protein